MYPGPPPHKVAMIRRFRSLRFLTFWSCPSPWNALAHQLVATARGVSEVNKDHARKHSSFNLSYKFLDCSEIRNLIDIPIA